MNFEFTDEQKLFAQSVRRFALAHLERDALQHAHNPRFPFDVAKLMSKQGLIWITVAEADGLEILKNRIAEHVCDRRFHQRPRHADAAE